MTNANTSGAGRRVLKDADEGIKGVPFMDIELPSGAEPPLRRYTTEGPGAPPEEGLAPLRAAWIAAREDVEEIAGRPIRPEDDGIGGRSRATSRPGTPEGFP